MKRILVILTCCCFSFLYSQESNKGLFRLGLSSDVTQTSLINIPISPSLQYFISNEISVGGAFSFEDIREYSTSNLEAQVRYYLGNLYGLGGLSTDFEGDDRWSFGFGYTSFFGKRFYVEPSVVYHVAGDLSRVGIRVGVGVSLN